jgi:hypothetical protein
MNKRASVRFRLWMVLTTLAAVLAALAVPGLSETSAQISIIPTPTYTYTPPAPTDTPTPVPPTSTPTPVPDAPQLSSINVDPPEALAAVGALVDFTVYFTEPSLVNSLVSVVWYWGDGTSSSCLSNPPDCTIDPGDGLNGTVSASHAYGVPGIYAVQLTMVDISGQFDVATYEFVVVYDANGGFVTGAGWIDSWPGAYRPNPTLAGKATFGFVSGYRKGATVPTGNTGFEFQAGSLNFRSEQYQWLVVNQGGTNAQYRGSGTINGEGDYEFMLWAGDDNPDTFRLKIWWEEGDAEYLVYDNGSNGLNQEIGGGSIVIHTSGN